MLWGHVDETENFTLVSRRSYNREFRYLTNKQSAGDDDDEIFLNKNQTTVEWRPHWYRLLGA